MPPLKQAGLFLLKFALVYGLLLAPWPGWKTAYGAWFRTFNHAAFHSNEERVLEFSAASSLPPPLDTEIAIGNRAKADANGNLAGVRLGLDSWGVGWVPTALLIALVLASPVALGRMALALVLGAVLVHAFVAFSVGCDILSHSSDIGLVNLSPLGKRVASGLEETFITQLGPSFVVPTMIWLLVTFRVRDLFGPAVSRV